MFHCHGYFFSTNTIPFIIDFKGKEYGNKIQTSENVTQKKKYAKTECYANHTK